MHPQFLSSLNQNHRNVIHQLQTVTGPKIFPVLAKYSESDVSLTARKTHPAFLSAIKFNNETKVSKLAPILYEDGVKNQKKLFKSKSLALVQYFPGLRNTAFTDKGHLLDVTNNSFWARFT